MKTQVEKTLGIVLKKIPYGEGDLIVTFLTQEGRRLSVFAPKAQQSKKRYGGGLDLFNSYEIIFQERSGTDLLLLKESQVVKEAFSLHNDLLKFAVLNCLAELILEFFQDREVHPEVYDALQETLNFMETHGAIPLFMLPLMEYGFLSLFGFKPKVDLCHLCHQSTAREVPYYFYASVGGVVCEPCHPSFQGSYRIASKKDQPQKMSSKALNFLIHYSLTDIQNESLIPSREELLNLKEALEYFIQYTAGKSFKTFVFMTQLVGDEPKKV